MIFLVAIAQPILTLAMYILVVESLLRSNPRDVSYTLVIGPYLLHDPKEKTIRKVSDDIR